MPPSRLRVPRQNLVQAGDLRTCRTGPRPRRSCTSAERPDLVSFRLPRLNSLWLVGFAADAQVSSLSKEELRRLLADLEAEARTNALDIGDHYSDPFVMRLRALGIESVHAMTPKAGRDGTVMVRPGAYGGFGWSGSTIDTWLDALLASGRGSTRFASSAAPMPVTATSSSSTRSARRYGHSAGTDRAPRARISRVRHAPRSHRRTR